LLFDPQRQKEEFNRYGGLGKAPDERRDEPSRTAARPRRTKMKAAGEGDGVATNCGQTRAAGKRNSGEKVGNTAGTGSPRGGGKRRWKGHNNLQSSCSRSRENFCRQIRGESFDHTFKTNARNHNEKDQAACFTAAKRKSKGHGRKIPRDSRLIMGGLPYEARSGGNFAGE